jgi:hypothetical protein
MWSKTIELARNSAVALRALDTALRPIVGGD